MSDTIKKLALGKPLSFLSDIREKLEVKAATEYEVSKIGIAKDILREGKVMNFKDSKDSKNSYTIELNGNKILIKVGKGFDGTYGASFTITIKTETLEDIVNLENGERAPIKDVNNGDKWNAIRKSDLITFESISGTLTTKRNDLIKFGESELDDFYISEELTSKQKKLDHNKDGDIDASDLHKVRKHGPVKEISETTATFSYAKKTTNGKKTERWEVSKNGKTSFVDITYDLDWFKKEGSINDLKKMAITKAEGVNESEIVNENSDAYNDAVEKLNMLKKRKKSIESGNTHIVDHDIDSKIREAEKAVSNLKKSVNESSGDFLARARSISNDRINVFYKDGDANKLLKDCQNWLSDYEDEVSKIRKEFKGDSMIRSQLDLLDMAKEKVEGVLFAVKKLKNKNAN